MDVNTDDTDLAALFADVDAAIDEAGIAPEKTEDAPESNPEEIEDVQESEEVTETESDADPEPAAEQTAEEVARAKGWRPKEEFTGDGEWIDAAEFNRRQPLYDRLSTQNKELKNVKKTLDAVVKYQKDQEAKIRQKVIAEIEAKKREAVKYADTEAFDAAEAELKAVNETPVLEIEEEPDEVTPQSPPPEAVDLAARFVKSNPWFDDQSEKFEPDLKVVMLNRTEMIVRQGKTLEEAIPLALAHVKTVFPAKFTNPNKNKPAAVMSGNRDHRQKGKTISDLTPEQKDVWRFYKSHNIMSEKDFLISLEE